MTTKIDAYEIIYATDPLGPKINLISGDKYSGEVRFYPDSNSQAGGATLDGDVIFLRYHQRDFSNVVDLLHNEKSVYWFYDGGPGPGWGGLQNVGAERFKRLPSA